MSEYSYIDRLNALQSRGHIVEMCGPATGHSVAPVAFCLNEAHATRIVACLRALTGIPTEEIEAGLIGDVIDAVTTARNCTSRPGIFAECDAVLTRLGKE